MNRLQTCPNNKNKHPGIVDLSPQRCTPAQKRADDEKTAEEKQAQEDARKVGIRHLAEVEERTMQRLKAMMASGPGPRVVDKIADTAPSQVTSTRVGMAQRDGLPVKKKGKAHSVQEAGKNYTLDASQDNETEENQGKTKKARADRATYRKEVEAEKTKGWSAAGSHEDDESDVDLPTPLSEARKPNMSSNAKKDFSGPHTKNVQQWVSKVQSTGLPLQAVGRTASNHSYATTIANTELATTSAGSQCLGSSSNDGLGYRRFDFEGSDGAYRDALKNLPRLSQRLPSVDIVEVHSSRDLSPVSNAVFSFSSNKATENFPEYPSYDQVHVREDTSMGEEICPHSYSNNDDGIDEGLLDYEDSHFGQMKLFTDADTMMGDQVTVKKTEDCLTVLSMTHVAKGESSKKATNKDLPVGAQPAYRRDVVPTIWHWAAGHALDPFNINEDDMVKALAVIWKFVYDNSVPFKIPPIVSLTNQRFSEWRNSFTSAATSAVACFFASNEVYLQHDSRVAFALDMKHHYRFLFSDSFSEDHMEWSGMWRGPMFLQIFASQLNATSSRVSISELGSEIQGYEGAMALAAAALERTLTLLANGEIDINFVIEDKETMGHKRKRTAAKKAVWKLEQLSAGPAQPFSDALWGEATREFMSHLINEVPPDAMSIIVYEAKLVAQSQKAKTSKVMVPSENVYSERAKLAFR